MYKTSLILGRFQMLHNGHEMIINKAIKESNTVLVFIGSADKENTKDNPFSYELRKKLLETIYQDKIIIKPLNDIGVGNCSKWGDYVISEALKYDLAPEAIFYGNEDKCESWFTNYPNIKYERVDRGIIPISASILREYLYNNEYEKWKEFTNPLIHKYYSELRLKLIMSQTEKKCPNTIMDSDIIDILDI